MFNFPDAVLQLQLPIGTHAFPRKPYTTTFDFLYNTQSRRSYVAYKGKRNLPLMSELDMLSFARPVELVL